MMDDKARAEFNKGLEGLLTHEDPQKRALGRLLGTTIHDTFSEWMHYERSISKSPEEFFTNVLTVHLDMFEMLLLEFWIPNLDEEADDEAEKVIHKRFEGLNSRIKNARARINEDRVSAGYPPLGRKATFEEFKTMLGIKVKEELRKNKGFDA